jgi:hypothetical protein
MIDHRYPGEPGYKATATYRTMIAIFALIGAVVAALALIGIFDLIARMFGRVL